MANSTVKNIGNYSGSQNSGKTTLFTAIKICLYGFKEAGYQMMNTSYKKNIKSPCGLFLFCNNI